MEAVWCVLRHTQNKRYFGSEYCSLHSIVVGPFRSSPLSTSLFEKRHLTQITKNNNKQEKKGFTENISLFIINNN